MKKQLKIVIALLCTLLMGLSVLCACGPKEKEPEKEQPIEAVDYVSQLKLDMTSETKKQEVTVRLFVDGDTTHFDPIANSQLTPGYTGHEFDRSDGYIKARYLAVDTPESTGQIEKWGKTASNFTRSKLESADSIIVESNDGNWNYDSTSSNRILLWIWYKPKGESEYKNLNIEILQNGFALASSTSTNRYGDIAMKALNQARELKLHVYSPKETVDENFFDGAAIPMTLKEVRCHPDDYLQKSVRVEGVIVAEFNNSVYLEEFDPETGLYFGMQVYYGFSASSALLKVLSIGNRVEIVGKVEYYEAGGTYQISGLGIHEFRPDPATDSSIISTGHEAAFQEIDPKNLNSKLTVSFEREDENGDPLPDEEVTINYGEAILGSSAQLSHLKVVSTYTTHNGGSSDGAITLTCKAEDGTTVTVRTEVLKDANGAIVTADVYEGKTITVKGIIEKYDGAYQLKCHLFDYFTFED